MKKNKRSDKFFAVTFIFLFTACSALVIFHAPRAMSEKENRTQAEQNAYVKFALQTEKLHKKLDRKEKYSYDNTYLPETDVNMLFDWYEAKMLKDDQLTKRI